MTSSNTEMELETVFKRPEGLVDVAMRYCPGCTHGIAHRLVAEVLEEMNLVDRTVAIASVGCSVYAFEYFNTDVVQAAHGRAPAVATGIKRSRPETFIFTYQGDGDLAAIGLGEILHAAARGERLSVVFINNAVFGMTQGQMAPTTLVGQKTTTTPGGRDTTTAGMPLMICEMMTPLPGVAYVARQTLIDPKHVRAAKKAIRGAFEAQTEDKGLGLVELVSTCPTWWYKDPLEAAEWVRTDMLKQYPLGVFKDWREG